MISRTASISPHTPEDDMEETESYGSNYSTANISQPPKPPDSRTHYRNLAAFWLLGLCNNYAYVVMLSAAHDILHPAGNITIVNNSTRECNPTSTGAILLADILPSLLVKLLAPFFLPYTHFRVMLVVLLAAGSFLLTSFSVASWMSYLGVVCASFSSGLGEVTFLSYSSYFHKDVVSTWSSGTGGAGVFGALSYAGMTSIGITPRQSLLIMLAIPILLAISFWVLLVHPNATRYRALSIKKKEKELEDRLLPDDDDLKSIADPVTKYSFRYKLTLMKPLLKYMIPLSLVYFAEYFINQGLMELIYFNGIWLNHQEQYRWYQVDYQMGVLISRSSVNFIKIGKLWLLPILQIVNLILVFFQAYFLFFPTIWIMLILVFYEGLLGGAAYVNTFYKISQEIPKEHREFSMGVTSMADTFGIALSGIAALPVHDAMCLLPPPK